MIKKALLKYFILLFALAALCAAKIFSVSPFGAGFAAALVYCGLSYIIVLPVYLSFTLIFDFSISTLIYALCVCATTIGAYYLSRKFTKAKTQISAAAIAAAQFSLACKLGSLGILTIAVWGILSIGIFVAAVCFLKPAIIKNFKYVFLETELVCGAVLLIAASLGLNAISIFKFNTAYLLAGFVIPFAVAAGSLSCGVAVGISFGCGISLYTMNPSPISFMAFAAITCAIFASAPKPISSLAVTAAYVLAAYLFGVPPLWQELVCFAVGALMFSIVPKRAVSRVHDLLFSPVTAVAARAIVNRAAEETGKNLLGASRIFDDMKSAVMQVPPPDDGGVLEKKVCSHCKNYSKCSAKSGFKEALTVMENDSAQMGRASVSQVPQLLADCENLSALISGATESAQERHELVLVRKAKCEGRKIVAHQLGLMAGVLRQISASTLTPVEFNTPCENKIADELSYRGAAVAEVMVTERKISVVMQSDDITPEDAAVIISKAMKKIFKFVRASADVLPGYTLLLYEVAPRYDIAFYAASSAVAGRCGDSHSFTRLGGDRFMLALCDGMGSGDGAADASGTAIELVESFFRAGLDSMSAVECVNKFLTLNECERFSTLDITVIDLNTGSAEIIKLSAPPTVIRASSGVKAVSGSSLPMGVFESVSCSHTSIMLGQGDEVIMTTDGVTDVLGSEGIIAAASTVCPDPKARANGILGCAQSVRKDGLSDDGTVLCARIFERKL